MTRDRLIASSVCVASLGIALFLSPTAPADPPSWHGEYAITSSFGQSRGLAGGRQPEVQYTDTVRIPSSCTSGNCTARSLAPCAQEPDVPGTGSIHLDGSSWTQVSDFQWDCMIPRHDPMTGPNDVR